MKTRSEVLELLRELPGVVPGTRFAQELRLLPFSWLSRVGVPAGLPRGGLVEITGPAGGGKTEATFRFLAENPKLRVAWIEESMTLYPCAAAQQQMEVQRVLFIESCERSPVWTVHQILRSQVFGVVVLVPGARARAEIEKVGAEVAYRRLQLEAEKAGATLIVLADEPAREGSWPMTVRLAVTRGEAELPMIEVTKYRGVVG